LHLVQPFKRRTVEEVQSLALVTAHATGNYHGPAHLTLPMVEGVTLQCLAPGAAGQGGNAHGHAASQGRTLQPHNAQVVHLVEIRHQPNTLTR